MPSVADPSSSEFRVFPPVRRRSGGVGAVSATPLPPRHDLPHVPLVRCPSGRHGSTWGKDRCATVFRPFFTVFDRFPDLLQAEIRSMNQAFDRYSLAARPLENGGNGKTVALEHRSLELGEELLARVEGGVPDLRTGRAEMPIPPASDPSTMSGRLRTGDEAARSPGQALVTAPDQQ